MTQLSPREKKTGGVLNSQEEGVPMKCPKCYKEIVLGSTPTPGEIVECPRCGWKGRVEKQAPRRF